MLFNVNKAIRYYLYFLCICLLFFIFGCSHSKKEMRAYVDDGHHWKMIEDCGTESCYPKVDYLTNDIMTIRLEFTNEKQGNYFMVQTYFQNVSEPLIFSPSQINFKLKNGDILKAKALTCSYTWWDINVLRSYSSLDEPITINKKGCYLLFFDHPILSAEEELIMDMEKAVIVNGGKSNLPIIHFRKATNRDK